MGDLAMGDFSDIPFSAKALQELCILQSAAREFGALRFVSIDVKMRCLLCDMCAEGAESVLNHVHNQHAASSLSSDLFSTQTTPTSQPERLPAIQKQREPSIYEDEQDTLFDFDFKPPMLDLQSEFDFQNDGALHITYTRDLCNAANVAKVSICSASDGKEEVSGLNTQNFSANLKPSSCHATTMMRQIVNESCDQVGANQISPEANCDLSSFPANNECDKQFEMQDASTNMITSDLANIENTQPGDFGATVSRNEDSSSHHFYGLSTSVPNISVNTVGDNCYADFNTVSSIQANTSRVDQELGSAETKEGFDTNIIASTSNDNTSSTVCLQNCDIGNASNSFTSTINEKDFMSCQFKPTGDMIYVYSNEQTRYIMDEGKEKPTEKISSAEHSYSKVESGNIRYLQTADGNVESEQLTIMDHTDNEEQMNQVVTVEVKTAESLEIKEDDLIVSKSGCEFDERNLVYNTDQHMSDQMDDTTSSVVLDNVSLQQFKTDILGDGNKIIKRTTVGKTSPSKKKKANPLQMNKKMKADVSLPKHTEETPLENGFGEDLKRSVKTTMLMQEETSGNTHVVDANGKSTSLKPTSKRKVNTIPNKSFQGLAHEKHVSEKEEVRFVNKFGVGKKIAEQKSSLSKALLKSPNKVDVDQNSKDRHPDVYDFEMSCSSEENNDVIAQSLQTAKEVKKRKVDPENLNPCQINKQESTEEVKTISKEKRAVTCVYCAEEFPRIADCLQHYGDIHKDSLQSRVEKTNQTLISATVKKRRNEYILSRTGKPYVDDFDLGIKIDVRMLKKLDKGDKDTIKNLKWSSKENDADNVFSSPSEESDCEVEDPMNSSVDDRVIVKGDFNSDPCHVISSKTAAMKTKQANTTSDKYRICPLCYQTLKKSALENHVSIVHFWNRVSRNNNSSGEFKCEECAKVFKYKKNLTSHQKTVHRGEMRPDTWRSRPELKCTSCDYVTRERRRLEVHVQSKHMGLMPYKCQYCDFTSRERTATKDHTYRHFKQKPISCNHCEFECIQKSSMMTHLKKKHNIKLPTLNSCKLLGTTLEGRLERQSILEEHKKHITTNTLDDIEVKKLDIHELLGPTYGENEPQSEDMDSNSKSPEVLDLQGYAGESESDSFSEEYTSEGSLKNSSTEESQNISNNLTMTVNGVSTNNLVLSPISMDSSHMQPTKVSFQTSASVGGGSYTLIPKNGTVETPIYVPIGPDIQNSSLVVPNAIPIRQMVEGYTTPSGLLYKVTPSVHIVSSAKTSTIQYKPVSPVMIGEAVKVPASNQNYRYIIPAKQAMSQPSNKVQVLEGLTALTTPRKIAPAVKTGVSMSKKSQSISVQEILLSDNNNSHSRIHFS